MADRDSLRRLLDAEAIRNLVARYGLLADAGDGAGVAGLWIENGEYDVGGFGIARGRAEIAALFESETHRGLMEAGCAHVLSAHHVEIDGNEAVATGYSTVFRRTADGFEPWRVAANRWELCRQANGDWLVTRRVNRPLGASGG